MLEDLLKRIEQVSGRNIDVMPQAHNHVYVGFDLGFVLEGKFNENPIRVRGSEIKWVAVLILEDSTLILKRSHFDAYYVDSVQKFDIGDPKFDPEEIALKIKRRIDATVEAAST